MSELFEEIYQSLNNGGELALATIISHRGSTPRTSGSNMLVYPDGRISGTIGGGIVEGDVIKSALGLFATQDAVISSYSFSQTNSSDMDLVCGGEMQVLIEHFAADRRNHEMFGLICNEIHNGRSFLWVGKVTSNGRQYQVERAVQTVDNRWLGPLQKENSLQEKLNSGSPGPGKTALVSVEKHQYVVSALQPPDTVYIIGGGHVSKEIAQLTRQVGFRTMVFDDRENFANPERFHGVDGVHICKDYADVFGGFSVTPSSCIVIVTRGHRFDKEVLAQSLRTEAGYIGMIGSRKKRASIYRDLLNDGFEQDELDRVHCPIGLSIDAETPAEIGVSIVAELIKHRANRKNHG